MKCRAIALICVLACASTAHGDRRWLRANFHAHAATDHVSDDGTERVAELHRAVRAAGFDFSVHTPHCTTDTGSDAAERYAIQHAAEAALKVSGLAIALGEELSVADGPNYARHTTVLGRSAPGNLNHLTIVGNQTLLPSHTLSPAEACERVHQDGGLCIVNHPGPGPMMWEDGYWEAPRNRSTVDALEVYNGQALAAIGIDFESRYLEATAYRGLGLKVAATTGADTHGPKSVARARATLAGIAGPARKLLRIVLPQSGRTRPELDAATLVQVELPEPGHALLPAVVAAVHARRTIAVYAMPKLSVTVDGLGELRRSREVHLTMRLSRKLEEVTLYREGMPVKTWHDVNSVEWSETLTASAAYVFGARDGESRVLTSAIWYEPTK